MSNSNQHLSEPSGKRLSKEDRREQLIAISVELFNQQRYEDICITDIAKAAGISHGLIYHYFSSKESCFLAAVQASSELLIDELTPPEGLSNPERVEFGIKKYVDFLETYSIAYLNLFRSSAASLSEIKQVCDAARATIIEKYIDAIDFGDSEIDTTKLDLKNTKLAFKGYLGWAETVVLDWLENRQIDRKVVERMLSISAIAAVYVGLENDLGEDAKMFVLEQLKLFASYFKIP